MTNRPDKIQKFLEWRGWLAIVPLGFIAVATIHPGTAPPQTSAVAEAPASSIMRDELRSWAPGKTKQQVRQRFGTPMTVRENDGDADWIYNTISAIDPSSGAASHLVAFHFSGTDGMAYDGKAEYAVIED